MQATTLIRFSAAAAIVAGVLRVGSSFLGPRLGATAAELLYLVIDIGFVLAIPGAYLSRHAQCWVSRASWDSCWRCVVLPRSSARTARLPECRCISSAAALCSGLVPSALPNCASAHSASGPRSAGSQLWSGRSGSSKPGSLALHARRRALRTRIDCVRARVAERDAQLIAVNVSQHCDRGSCRPPFLSSTCE